MKERGMIFNADMVRAILDGRKTQTRRVMKPQPTPCDYVDEHGKARGGHQWPSNIFRTMLHVEGEMQNGDGGWRGAVGDACPFGDVGDRLWVRETFSCIGNEDGHPINANGDLCERENAQRIYKASSIQKLNNYGLWTSPDGFDFEGHWTPSIHMPRWASRITLEITGVRVERLSSISEEDAQAEGVSPATYMITPPEAAYRVGFRHLWESIYGEESWRANPWMWVIEFKRR